MTTVDKVTELKKELWRFSNFEKTFLREIETKKKGLSPRQERLLDELYQRAQGQKSWKSNGQGPA